MIYKHMHSDRQQCTSYLYFTRRKQVVDILISLQNLSPNPLWLHSYLFWARCTHTQDIYIYASSCTSSTSIKNLISHLGFSFQFLFLVGFNFKKLKLWLILNHQSHLTYTHKQFNSSSIKPSSSPFPSYSPSFSSSCSISFTSREEHLLLPLLPP